MDASLFISRRLRFKGGIAMVSIAVSFLVMIVAVSVSAGFRHEIRKGVSDMIGDVQIVPPDQNLLDESSPIESRPAYLSSVMALECVQDVRPVIYRAGIVKHEDNIHGVLLKGVGSSGESLKVSVPERLAAITGLGVEDRMLTYFIGEKVKPRQFTISDVHEAPVMTDENMVVYAGINDLQRVAGWNDGQVSSLEVILKPEYRDNESIMECTREIGATINAFSSEDEAPVIAVSSVSRYPQLFGWLDLIDFNVFFILVLMTIVAGFNMISGLLIMLFENISTIGLLKSLGMTDRAIAKVFLSSSAVLVFKGMLAGNIIALLFCAVQSWTHLIPLDPENYFVSFVPMHMNIAAILGADIAAFLVIMLLLLIPSLFISRVDPARTVRVN